MSRRRILVLGGIMFLLAGIVFFPLSVAMEMAGLSRFGLTAQSASGTIWNGRLEHVQIGDIPLGPLGVRLSPASLLTGKVRLAIRGEGLEPLGGSLFSGLSGFGVDGLTGGAPLIGIPPFPGGTVTLKDVGFAFSGKRCTRAAGQVRIALESTTLPFGRSMIGNVRCEAGGQDGDAIGIALTGASAMEKLQVRVRPDGEYAASLIIRAPDADSAAGLRLFGFRETQAGFVITFSGQF
jgi:general secretion pathway protein N